MKKIKEEKRRRASLATPDFLAEAIQDPLTGVVEFAVYRNGETDLAELVESNGETYYPLDSRSDIISKGIVLLPSCPAHYGTLEDLISEIQKFIHKYLDISPRFERIAAYYVLLSWLYDRFDEVPYLRAIGDFGSGKSRLLKVIGSICYKPIFTGGATTPAPIFRILDEVKGTLILDEADLKFSDMTTDLVKILNMGYQKGGSVLRMQGKDMMEMKAFDVYSPKIVATRETFSDKALESRFLVEHMGTSTLRKDIPKGLSESFYYEARQLRNKLLQWRFDNYYKELPLETREIEGIHPRLHQIALPLLALIPSEEMKQSLIGFMQDYNRELAADRGQSWEADVVLSVLQLEHQGNRHPTIKEITKGVNNALDLEDDHLQPKKVGWIMRNRLHLKTYRARNGYTLSTAENQERLGMWKERFGISDADVRGEDVNIVNVPEEDDIKF